MRLHLALVAALALLATPASADAALDAWSAAAAHWARSVDRSEALLRTAVARGTIEPGDREATLTQIRDGAASLRILTLAAIAADSTFAGPLVIPPPVMPRQGQWGNRFIRTTGLVAFGCGMVNLVAGMREADPEFRQMLGNVSGIVGGSGALYSIVRPRPKQPPWVDPNERMKTLVREMLLHDTFVETGHRLREVSDELGAIHPDSSATDSATVDVAHRYAGVIDRASALLDVEVPHETTVARSGGDYANFNDAARARLSRLADRLDAVVAQWKAWRWLAGKSQRVTLEHLTFVEQE